MRSALLQEWAPILPMAAATIGAVQIRNRGTIGGNLGTASPAGDTLPALMALRAEVILRRKGGERRLPLQQFLTGPGKTGMAPEEYISAVWFPTPAADGRGVFFKAGRRKAQAVTLVSVGVQIAWAGEMIGSARIALGSVAPTVVRAEEAEALLDGKALTADLCQQAAQSAAREVQPITDLRASAGYRRSLVEIWVRRALESFI